MIANHVWLSHMIVTYDTSYVVIICDMWSHVVEHTCDLRVWCSPRDVHIWNSHMISVYDVHMTSNHIPLRWISYDAHMWLTYIITDMIIYTHKWYKHIDFIYDSIIWLHTHDYHTYCKQTINTVT